jgi:trans-feruloyl-CoA hydratase/vanillin synthase
MAYTFLRVDRSEDSATLTIDRPDKRNALHPALHEEFLDALTRLEQDTRLKSLVITGVDDSFCAGMDLQECFFRPFDQPDEFRRINSTAQAWFRKLRQFPVPTLAKVNGWCFGGGVLIVGLCDLAVTDSEAVFGLSEINFGSFPGGGTTWAVAHNLPRKHAMFYITTGETFTGARAAEIGLVNFAVPRAELDARTAEIIGSLSQKHRGALVASKEVYEGTLARTLPESIEWEMAKLFELSYYSEDDWINSALAQFDRREYKPGFEPYELTEETQRPADG